VSERREGLHEAAEALAGPEVEHILVVRAGHGANCSSIGSVIDTLFATATVGAAIFAAVAAALKAEEVSLVSPPPRRVEEGRQAPPEKEP
jgi:hypothetical protein